MLTFNFAFSQDFSYVDLIVKAYPKKFSKPEKLANLISNDFQTDHEKTRAIYTWLINNVSYDLDEAGKYNYSYTNSEERTKKEKKQNLKLSRRVVSKRKAVCEGYAVLFKRTCDLLNIKAKIVTGNAKTKIRDIGRRYKSDHAWNMVEIENNKYLIDATWGAGNSKRRPSYYYFSTNPEEFINKHYPDNYYYSLLDNQIEKEDYLNSPLIYHKDNQYLKLIYPLTGVLNKKELKKVSFILTSDEAVSSISYRVGRKNISISDFKQNQGKVGFEIDLTKIKARDLLIFINTKAFVGYRLK